MPRGYLKRARHDVGKKASRGGSSKPRCERGCTCEYCTNSYQMKLREQQLQNIMEEDIFESKCQIEVGDLRYYDPYYDDYPPQPSRIVAEMYSPPKATTTLGSFIDQSLTTTSTNNEYQQNQYHQQQQEETVDTFNQCAEKEESDYSLCGESSSVKYGDNVVADEDSSTGFSIVDEFTCMSLDASAVLVGRDHHNSLFDETSDDSYSMIEMDADDDCISCMSEIDSKAESTVNADNDNETTAVLPMSMSIPTAANSCALCLQETPWLPYLMFKCDHPRACHECLRKRYIEDAPKDIGNYPLRCFWPGCRGCLRELQVRRFAKNKKEMLQYFNNMATAKTLRRQLAAFKNVYPCPNCPCKVLARPYKNFRQEVDDATTGTSFTIECLDCSEEFTADRLPMSEVMSVIAALGDDCCNCPACGIFITRDGGCDHMTCVCGANFSLSEAKR